MRRMASVAVGAIAVSVALAGCSSNSVGQTLNVESEQPNRRAGGNSKYLVMLGDSYMSGEGGRLVTNDVTSEGTAGAGFYRGDYADVYDKSQTGFDSIDYCHRTTSAPGYVGDGWNTVNLACSGAETVSGFSQPTDKVTAWKPGIDYAKNGSQFGQARMLESFATTHDVGAIVLSIGGNNFQFSKVMADCVASYIKSSECNDNPPAKHLENDATKKRVQAQIEEALWNIQRAMFAAKPDYRTTKWRLVYQTPPTPLSKHRDNTYPQALGIRQYQGGCGFRDSDLDWFNETAGPTVRDTMIKAVENFYSSGKKKGAWEIKVVDGSNAFDGHRLCDKSTSRIPDGEGGLSETPKWDESGAKSEWVSPVLVGQQLSKPYEGHTAQEPIHPTYWGQRSLASCVALGLDEAGANGVLTCKPDGNQPGDSSRPKMKITDRSKTFTQRDGLDPLTPDEIFARDRLTALQVKSAGSSAVRDYTIAQYKTERDVGKKMTRNAMRQITVTMSLRRLGATIGGRIAISGFLESTTAGSHGQYRYIRANAKLTIDGVTDCSGTGEFLVKDNKIRYIRLDPSTGCEAQAW